MRALSLMMLVMVPLAIACANDGKDGDGDGDGDGSGSGDGSGEQTSGPATDFYTKLAEAECNLAFSCKDSYPPEFGTFADDYGADAAACVTMLVESYDPTVMDASIAMGRVELDSAAVSTCLGELAATMPACTLFWEEGMTFPDTCETAFAGKVAQGGVCEADVECVGDLFCGPESGVCEIETPEEL